MTLALTAWKAKLRFDWLMKKLKTNKQEVAAVFKGKLASN